MKRKFRVKFVFDMRAFYADERIDGGLWNLRNPVFKAVYRFFKRKEVQFLTEADHSISLTSKGKQIIHSWNMVQHQPVPIEIIPCCADLDHFNPSQVDPKLQAELRAKLKLDATDLVITYLGSVGTWYMLDEMLDFFKVLLKKKPDSKFLFITPDEPNDILREAEKRQIPADRFAIDRARREEVPTYLSLANAAIFFIKPVCSKSGSSPTKHGEMLGMGLPVIANAGVGDVDSIIEDTQSGILVRQFTEKAYSAAADQIDDLMKIPVANLQAAARKYYSLEEGVKRYDGVYRSVCTNDDTSRSAVL
jgi:glycosyltransferase involved in cell wall biosynthesis